MERDTSRDGGRDERDTSHDGGRDEHDTSRDGGQDEQGRTMNVSVHLKFEWDEPEQAPHKRDCIADVYVFALCLQAVFTTSSKMITRTAHAV